ncbi:MAG: hypothetical protein ACNS63_07315 [Candidatus Nitrospinota bacterium M3_3B_026]
MEHIPPFRGLAGETVRLFVRPGTLFTVVPALVVTIILTAAGFFIADSVGVPDVFGLVISAAAISPVLGAYGMAARHGDLESGVMNILSNPAEIFSFAARYSALTVIWGVPASFAALWLMKKNVSFDLVAGGGPNVFSALGLVALLLLIALMPVFTLIVSLAAETIGEAVAPGPWGWLFVERREDLPAFFASYFGGMALFFIIMVPILLVITAVLFMVSFRAGLAAAGAAYVIPFAGAPVLLGRLAGSFVAAEESGPVEAGGAAPGGALTDIKDDFSIKRAVEQISQKAETDIITAIREAEELRASHQDNPVVLAELSRLYMKKGEGENALLTGRVAVSRALAMGLNDEAVKTFQALGKLRGKLKLEAKEFEKLARSFVPRGMFDEAVWCFRASAASGGDKIRIQKGIISVAEAAARAGNAKKAMAVYAFFIKSFPDSEFLGYCKNEYKKLNAGK